MVRHYNKTYLPKKFRDKTSNPLDIDETTIKQIIAVIYKENKTIDSPLKIMKLSDNNKKNSHFNKIQQEFITDNNDVSFAKMETDIKKELDKMEISCNKSIEIIPKFEDMNNFYEKKLSDDFEIKPKEEDNLNIILKNDENINNSEIKLKFFDNFSGFDSIITSKNEEFKKMMNIESMEQIEYQNQNLIQSQEQLEIINLLKMISSHQKIDKNSPQYKKILDRLKSEEYFERLSERFKSGEGEDMKSPISLLNNLSLNSFSPRKVVKNESCSNFLNLDEK